MKQLDLEPIVRQAFSKRRKAINAYIGANREKYIAFATMLTPSETDEKAILSRVAFAVLSANASLEDAIKALGYCLERYAQVENVESDVLRTYHMIGAKADWVNRLWYRTNFEDLLRQGDSWNDYRLRLRHVKGLGLTKASFAACLLYPLEADLACVDTWMQKVFLGNPSFKTLKLVNYRRVESQIRRIARTFRVSTFLAQWMIWDHARRRGPSNHAIFPGSHKGELP